ncbi:Tim44 domain-containing protein [Rhizobium halophytocola]|uniref:Lipid-binding transport protein (Tim44 family) n=1 Tax=Rhizobium halophytocola TaxID=735519 RepID=A0ABS4DT09_9HYPH|nr:Tim44 domain-containing protein [Rhizobium halophytocola]MBP1848828.1 putative lipid-binding transport protein (Tim44 family) [Rhizobium halophytocola]
MKLLGKYLSIAMIALIGAASIVDTADARRAGGFSSFGSRGTRTWSAPATTKTAPGTATGIERSMSPRTFGTSAASSAAVNRTRGFFGGGMFGGLMGGLLLGGLFGSLLGTGFGGGFGFLGMLLQFGILFFVARWAMRAFGNRQAGYAGSNSMSRDSYEGGNSQPGFKIPSIGGGLGGALGGGLGSAAGAKAGGDELGIGQGDLERFESLLKEMQAAYATEDYSALRRITTPEAMSYLAEELGENATKGVKNEVKDVELLQGDVAESWNENGQDYATVAMRYQSVDFMVDRSTHRVVSGDPDHAGESVEVWTFVRRPGTEWQISAIQAAA